MTLSTYPTGVCLSGNLPKIAGNGSLIEVITMNLKKGFAEDLIVSEKYYPDSFGNFFIDLKELIHELLEVQIPLVGTAIHHQVKAYDVFEVDLISNIDAPASLNFTVVKGGVNYNPTISTFLSAYYLTWQPQTKWVKITDPEWLTYYTAVNAYVKVKAYFDGASPVTAELTALTPGRVNTVNVKYSLIDALFGGTPIAYDIWLGNDAAEKLTYTQRYIVTAEEFEFDSLFVFENTLGGVDTIRFTGECIEDNEVTVKRALFDKITKEYYTHNLKIYRKNTGIFRTAYEWQWVLEFFKSKNRAVYENLVAKSITVQETKLSTKEFDLNSGEFEYSLAEDNQYFSTIRQTGVLPDFDYPAPYQPTIYFGYCLARPTTAAAILALPQSQPASDVTGTLNTLTNKKFNITIPDTHVLVEVYNASAEEDVTSEYITDLQMIIVAGAMHKSYTMEMAANYLSNQEHNFTIAYE